MTFNFNVHGITPDDVNTGGGGGSATVIKALSPTNTAGLCLWLDGQCNTRQGNDHTKTYMENLVWNVPLVTDQTNREVFGTNTNKNVWNNDLLKLAALAYYPICTAESLTIEFVFMIDDDYADGAYINPWRQDYDKQGFYTLVQTLTTGVVLEFAAVTENDGNQSVLCPIERNKFYYFCGMINGKLLKTFLNSNIDSLTMPSSYAKTISTKSFSGVGLGVNGADSDRWKGLNLGMLRIWNRVLTDSEIQQNYTDAQRRFNF